MTPAAPRLLRTTLLGLLLAAPLALGLPGDQTEVEPLAPLDVHPSTSRNIIEQLARHHYVKQKLDDDLSSEIFDRYLEMLDPQRAYLLAEDVRRFEKYRYLLDDALRDGDLEPAFEIFNRYQQAMAEQLRYNLEVLDGGLDEMSFDEEQFLDTDRAEDPWLADPEARRDLWYRRLKSNVLGLKLNDKPIDEIAELLGKRYENRLNRLGQTKSEDAFQIYMNAVASSFDPHTQYFSPRTSENFNINMSLSLEGIGAVLRSEDEYTTIVRLVPAGPAEKSDKLHPSDRITGVAQGDEGELVDVIGWRLDDVVDLIRGPAGTTVRLEVLPAGAETGAPPKTIRIVREAVKLEEQSAQSRVLDLERNGSTHRVGVIDIPTFYVDFQAMQEGNPDYKSTTRDVRRLIEALRADGVEGIVIDLRNNGGGSLQEANALTGLFIEAGPTVQIRSAGGRVDLFNDEDGEVAWDGPLVVLVNRLSASASEIFAGAIQDYQRGLVIGSQTFGKGTVQTLIPLERGQLKMTQAKFYRVTGQSTQHQGVIPDIEFPEIYDHDEIGESSLDDALPWDVIRPTRFRRDAAVAPLLSVLENRHQARVADDPEFDYLDELLARSRERAERDRVSLREATRRAEREDEESWRLALENRRRIGRGEEPVSSLDEIEENEEQTEPADADAAGAASSEEVEDGTDVAESDSDLDALLEESGHILLDYVTLRQSVAELDGERVSRSN